MFEGLKKKIFSWLGKEEKSEAAEEVKEKEIAGDEEVEARTKKEAGEAKKEVKESEKELKEIKEAVTGEVKEKEHDKKIEERAEEKKAEEAEEVGEEGEEEIEEEGEEKQGFFSRLMKKIVPGTTTLKQEHFDEMFPELETTLLENNVALEVVDKIRENLSKDLVGIEVKKDKIEETIMQSLKDTINSILIEPDDLINRINKKLDIFTIVFFGINGSGKTTSIAKFASKLRQNGISCVLAAADTFRAASIEQLQKHGEKLGVKVIASSYGADPASVAFDAKKYAEKNNIKAVLVDTAGRMHTKANLLKEMEKIVRIAKPDIKVFVGESITGNDAVVQAKSFNEAIGIDGIILSKADVDEKAGTILSVSYVTGKPIYYLGVGQDYEDLKDFKKQDVLKHLGLE